MSAHDLSSDPTAVERVTELARGALGQWPGCETAGLRLLTVSENATFLVEAGDRRRVLRVHRLDYHAPGAIESELAWLSALGEGTGPNADGASGGGAIRTAAVMAAGDGRRVVQRAEPGTGRIRSCVMFEWLEGREPGRDPAAFEHLGSLTASMHRHARAWTPPHGFTRFTWDVDATIGAVSRWGRWEAGPGVGPDQLRLLGRLAAVVGARLDAFGTDRARFGLIHADLRLANLLVDDEGVTSVIDFDDCGYGWLLYDLAAAVSFFEDDPVVPELIEHWLTGYRRVLALPVEDEAEIWTLVMLRRLLLLAWIASHGAAAEAGLGAEFTTGTCALAEAYLRTHPDPRRARGAPCSTHTVSG